MSVRGYRIVGETQRLQLQVPQELKKLQDFKVTSQKTIQYFKTSNTLFGRVILDTISTLYVHIIYVCITNTGLIPLCRV
jgi:hypothetical protein